MKIVNFYPNKSNNNLVGFAGLTCNIQLGNSTIEIAIKIKIMRNSHNGHVFVAMPSEKYKDKEGNDKYSDLVRVKKEDYDAFQKAASKAWDEYVMTNSPAAHIASIGQPNVDKAYYPHGLCQIDQPIQNSVQELPF